MKNISAIGCKCERQAVCRTCRREKGPGGTVCDKATSQRSLIPIWCVPECMCNIFLSIKQRRCKRHRTQMDTLGIEPRASRMLSGCDTTTPCALRYWLPSGITIVKFDRARLARWRSPARHDAYCCVVRGCTLPFATTSPVTYLRRRNVVPRGLEPRTLRLLAVRSNQLSYETMMMNPHQS